MATCYPLLLALLSTSILSPCLADAGAVDEGLTNVMADVRAPILGLSVLSLRDKQPVYRYVGGYRHWDESDPAKRLPVTEATLFRIASISKLVTAIGAMRLVEQGKLDLDVDISRYLGFRVRNPAFPGHIITARMLLTHTSSLRDSAGISFPPDVSLMSVLLPASSSSSTLSPWAAAGERGGQSPGKYFSYCNLNWGVLATIMESASGERFDRYMQRAVFKPLQITAGFNVAELPDTAFANIATLYDKSDGDPLGPWRPQADDFAGGRPAEMPGLLNYRIGSNGTAFGPQGRLRIRVEDLGKIAHMLMSGGVLDGRRILQAETIKQMQAEYWRYDPVIKNGDPFGGLFQSWGLGLQRFIDRGGPAYGDRVLAKPGFVGFGHLGQAYGLLSGLIYRPAVGEAMVYAMNGTSVEPDAQPAPYSSFSRWEADILTLVHQTTISPTFKQIEPQP